MIDNYYHSVETAIQSGLIEEEEREEYAELRRRGRYADRIDSEGIDVFRKDPRCRKTETPQNESSDSALQG